MNDFFVALGLFFVIEGVLYAAFPGLVRLALETFAAVPAQQLRLAGLICAGFGVTIIWLIRG